MFFSCKGSELGCRDLYIQGYPKGRFLKFGGHEGRDRTSRG